MADIAKMLRRGGRDSVILKNVAGSLVIQGAALIIALFTLPAFIRYFHDQQILGVWFTILSVLNWILSLDLGLGNGLRNRLVPILSENRSFEVRKYISSAYMMVLLTVTILGVTVLLGFPHIDWNRVFGVPVSTISRDVLTETVLITTMGILLQFLLRLIVSILYALQRSAITGLLSLASTAGLLLFVSIVDSGSNSESLVMLAIANVVAVNLPLVVAGLVVFSTSLRGCAPHIQFFDYDKALDVAKIGGVFFFLQVMYMLVVTTDPFLISQFTDPRYVVDYSIYGRFFTLGSTLFALALTPIWSAVTRASAEDDYPWIERLYARLKRMAIIAILGLFGFSWFLQWFVDIWLGTHAIVIDVRYSLVFAGLAGAVIWSGVMSTIVNGTGRLKVQLILLAVGVVLKFPLAFVLTEVTGSWIGVVAASLLALLPYCLIQPIWIKKYWAPIGVNSSPSSRSLSLDGSSFER